MAKFDFCHRARVVGAQMVIVACSASTANFGLPALGRLARPTRRAAFRNDCMGWAWRARKPLLCAPKSLATPTGVRPALPSTIPAALVRLANPHSRAFTDVAGFSRVNFRSAFVPNRPTRPGSIPNDFDLSHLASLDINLAWRWTSWTTRIALDNPAPYTTKNTSSGPR